MVLLSEKCPMCHSWKWCGRQCKFAPKEEAPVSEERKAENDAVTFGVGITKIGSDGKLEHIPVEDVLEPVPSPEPPFDRATYYRNYQRDYMRRKRAKDRAAKGKDQP